MKNGEISYETHVHLKNNAATEIISTHEKSLKQGRAPKIWQKIAEKRVSFLLEEISWYYNSNDHKFSYLSLN